MSEPTPTFRIDTSRFDESVTQKSRKQQFRRSKGVLLLVGGLTLVIYLFLFTQAGDEVNRALWDQLRDVDAATRKQHTDAVLQIVRIYYGVNAAIGIVYCILAMLVKRYPVASTASGLGLFVASNVISYLLSPEMVGAGLVYKAFIALALFESYRAATAYQKEKARLEQDKVENISLE